MGDTVSIRGMIVLVKLANYSPRPLMRVERVCRSDRFVIYLLRRFKKASGTSTGTPAQNKLDMTKTIKKLAASWKRSS
jgi:hypothetical protein